MMRDGWTCKLVVVETEPETCWSREFGCVRANVWNEDGGFVAEAYFDFYMDRNMFATEPLPTLEDAMLAAEQWVDAQTWPVMAPDPAADQAHREAVKQATLAAKRACSERAQEAVLAVQGKDNRLGYAMNESEEAIERLRDLALGA